VYDEVMPAMTTAMVTTEATIHGTASSYGDPGLAPKRMAIAFNT
jgi:hypothetical protein